MKKLLFLPILAFGITTYPDFTMCYNKYKKYSIIPISKHYSITSKKPSKYIKYDETLGIYLIKTKNKRYIHFKNSHLGVWIASIKKDSIYSGNYAEYQKSMTKPAKISTKTKPGSIISDIFCNPIGIGVNGGFLSKSYIKKFITYKSKIENHLKFLGIIYNKNLIITKILPNSIASKHYIKAGSKITKINGKKININNFPKNIKSVTILQEGLEFTIKVDK
jgi:hypothetical protein